MCISAENAEQARAFRNESEPDLVLLDIWMPDTDGVTLLKEWVEQDLLTMPVVMMSGHGTIETAVEATRIGAVDFLEKPIALQKLLSTIANVIRRGAAPLAQQAGAQTPEVKIPRQMPKGKHYHFPCRLICRCVKHVNISMRSTSITICGKRPATSRASPKQIGVERTHLYRKLKQLGIKLPQKGRHYRVLAAVALIARLRHNGGPDEIVTRPEFYFAG